MITNRQSIKSSQDTPVEAGHTTPHLNHKPEFEKILNDYQIDPQSLEMLQSTPMVIMSGPTATGRNTIIRELLKTGRYYYLISDTTRPPRQNDGKKERDGDEYHFRSEDYVLDELKHGQYIEAEVIHEQQVSGTHIDEVQAAKLQNKIALNEIEIRGALKTIELKPDVVAIMLLPPSFEEWLRRIKQRTAINQVELLRRLRTATNIFNAGLERDSFVFVVNDNLERAVKTVDDVARLGMHRTDTEAKSRQLARQLLKRTLGYLKEHETDTPTI